MKTVKILVVEDKMVVARDVAMHLEDLGYEVSGIANSGREALQSIKQNPPDLALLDINLKGDMDGIELAETLVQINPIPIIYVTAHNDKETLERARPTFPSAFIVKPYKKEDFGPAIDIALYQYANWTRSKPEEGEAVAETQQPEPEVEAPTIPEKHHMVNDSFFVKSDHCYEKLDIANILYIKAEGSYVKIFTENRNYLQTVNLNSFSRQLNHPNLVRIHRSYIINLRHLSVYEEGRVFINDAEIPIGKTYRGELFKHLQFLRTGTA